MRNPNRIPEILKELEKIWIANPDFRLGQIITVATRPSSHHPETFNIEDDRILIGLKSIGKVQPLLDKSIPYWEKYPEICRLDIEDITVELIEEYVQILVTDNYEGIITPIKLMELNGAPITDKNWMKGHQMRIVKLREVLQKINDKNLIKEVEIGYEIVNKASA